MASIFLTLSAVSSYVGSGSYTVSMPITLHIFMIFFSLRAFKNDPHYTTYVTMMVYTQQKRNYPKNKYYKQQKHLHLSLLYICLLCTFTLSATWKTNIMLVCH